MPPIERIIITGHPGTGKTLVARKLAEALRWEFINTDFELEHRSGRCIDDIMGTDHNNPFYQFERDMLAIQFEKRFCIINTDPHIICIESVRALLTNEFVVYLKADIPVQIERSQGHVPPLYPKADLPILFDKLHRQRDDLYEKNAALVIDTCDNAIEKHIRTIIEESGAKKNQNRNAAHESGIVLFHRLLHTPVELSCQQTKCLKLLAKGLSAKDIAKQLSISHRTVEGTLARIMEISGCTSSRELVSVYLSTP